MWKGGSEQRLLTPDPVDPWDPGIPPDEFQIVQIYCFNFTHVHTISLKFIQFQTISHNFTISRKVTQFHTLSHNFTLSIISHNFTQFHTISRNIFSVISFTFTHFLNGFRTEAHRSLHCTNTMAKPSKLYKHTGQLFALCQFQ